MNRHLNQEQEKRPGSLKPGQDLIIAGSIGLTGAALAARAGEKAVRERFSSQYAERIFTLDQGLLSQEEAEEIGRLAGATDMEMVGEGGFMNCLWRLLEAYGLGCIIELRAILLRQETVEACEVFDLNPYRLHSAGCFLMAADSGFEAVRELERRGFEGAVIGAVKPGPARRILNGEIETFLDRPKADELEKLGLLK